MQTSNDVILFIWKIESSIEFTLFFYRLCQGVFTHTQICSESRFQFGFGKKKKRRSNSVWLCLTIMLIVRSCISYFFTCYVDFIFKNFSADFFVLYFFSFFYLEFLEFSFSFLRYIFLFLPPHSKSTGDSNFCTQLYVLNCPTWHDA